MVSLGGSNVNRNKLHLAVLALAALAASIVAPVSAIVNFNHKVDIAEGSPLPPPPPKPPVIVAEGSPLPPHPPVLVAEGSPLPPHPPAVFVS
jgi:hypothetical protein